MTSASLEIMGKAVAAGCEVVLPIDAVVAKEFVEGTSSETVLLDSIHPDSMILDIGPASTADLKARFANCKTLLWNGPLGAFEFKPFDNSTKEVVNTINQNSKKINFTTIAGGGDTISAIKMLKGENAFS